MLSKNWRDISKIQYSEILHADRKIKKLLDEIARNTGGEEFGANYPTGGGEDEEDCTPMNNNRKRKRCQKKNSETENAVNSEPVTGTPVKAIRPRKSE